MRQPAAWVLFIRASGALVWRSRRLVGFLRVQKARAVKIAGAIHATIAQARGARPIKDGAQHADHRYRRSERQKGFQGFHFYSVGQPLSESLVSIVAMFDARIIDMGSGGFAMAGNYLVTSGFLLSELSGCAFIRRLLIRGLTTGNRFILCGKLCFGFLQGFRHASAGCWRTNWRRIRRLRWQRNFTRRRNGSGRPHLIFSSQNHRLRRRRQWRPHCALASITNRPRRLVNGRNRRGGIAQDQRAFAPFVFIADQRLDHRGKASVAEQFLQLGCQPTNLFV